MRQKKAADGSHSEGAATRHTILDAAIELVAEHGDRLALVDVAHNAGVSATLPSHHFGAKAGLLAAVLERLALRIPCATSKERDVARRLAENCGHAVRDVRADPVRTRALYVLANAPFRQNDLRALSAEWNGMQVAIAARAVRDGQEQGSIPAARDPKATALALAALVKGAVLMCLADQRLDPDRVADAVRQFALDAVAPHQGTT